jgi:hypothetical protein
MALCHLNLREERERRREGGQERGGEGSMII